MDGPSCVSNRASNGSPGVQRYEYLLDVEADTEPRIGYYDFVVSKTDAYSQLRPGYFSRAEYPSQVNAKNIIICSEKIYPCGVHGCTARPFTRQYDLERHFKSIHESRDTMSCDYKKCPHKFIFGKDHLREHYREFHEEDLEIKKMSQTIRSFLAIRSQDLVCHWWRCSKCLLRVELDDSGYTCPDCKVACEPERVAWRQKIIISQHSGCDINDSVKPGNADNNARYTTAKQNLLKSYTLLPLQNRIHIEKASRSAVSVRNLSFIRSSHHLNLGCFLIMLSLLAGVLMAVLYTWVNQRMKFGVPSAFMKEIIAVTVRVAPTKVVEASYLVSANVMLMSYLATSAVWAISIVGWITFRSRKSRLVYWYMYLLLTAIFWMLSGITPEELVLVFLPVSISAGGLLCTIYGRQCETITRGTSCRASDSMMPIEKENFLKISAGDGEMDYKV